MSIEQTDLIDIISIDRLTGETILTISDHLDWSDSATHLRLLQNKLNRYSPSSRAVKFSKVTRKHRIDRSSLP